MKAFTSTYQTLPTSTLLLSMLISTTISMPATLGPSSRKFPSTGHRLFPIQMLLSYTTHWKSVESFHVLEVELGRKVYITDDPSIKSSNPLPAVEDTRVHAQLVPNAAPNMFSNVKPEKRRTFHHHPNTNHT